MVTLPKGKIKIIPEKFIMNQDYIYSKKGFFVHVNGWRSLQRCGGGGDRK